MIGIYKITNIINEKCYIGQSVNIERRWKEHRTKYHTLQGALYDAIRKYGIENFKFEVIEETEEKLLNDREIYWINYFDSFNNGYNLTSGGQNNESHQKLSINQVTEIINLLQNSMFSQKDIADKFNVSQRTISSINLGEYYVQKDVVYPIRKGSYGQNVKELKNRKCIKCGTEIHEKNTTGFCLICIQKEQQKSVRPSRNELKNLIRKKPFTTIGKQYDVSDNAIRKWCESYNLPKTKKEINSYSDEEWDLI